MGASARSPSAIGMAPHQKKQPSQRPPLLARFLAQMEAALGEEPFAAACERGVALDPVATAVVVLEELERVMHSEP
ncbi:MAG: hypothetical protein R3272_16645 [Candidatus Promineifilaceae bacterium]|nr:hypothetical protein [Candidatus Promineifilaceae bacterium]